MIELVVVVAILAVLASVASNYYGDVAAQAREATVRNNLKVIRQAIEMHMKRHLEGPTKLSQLSLLDTVKGLTIYQMGDQNVELEVEIPDRGDNPPPPAPHPVDYYEGVSENVMVASHTKWVKLGASGDTATNLPTPPYTFNPQQFRNVRVSGAFIHW